MAFWLKYVRLARVREVEGGRWDGRRVCMKALPEARLESGKSRLALSRATSAAKTEEKGREEAGGKRHPKCLTSGKHGAPSVGSSSYRRGSAVLLPGEEGGGRRGGEGCGRRETVSRASDIPEQARQLHIQLETQHSH